MNRTELLNDLQVLFKEVLEQPSLVITEVSSAQNVEGWTSLNHVIIISEIEQKFGVTFTLDDLLSISNVGDICNLIENQLKA